MQNLVIDSVVQVTRKEKEHHVHNVWAGLDVVCDMPRARGQQIPILEWELHEQKQLEESKGEVMYLL